MPSPTVRALGPHVTAPAAEVADALDDSGASPEQRAERGERPQRLEVEAG